MAKKKLRKEGEKKEFQYTKELQGLLLVLIGLIGFGDFGIVGGLVKKFAIFLFGNWYVLFLILSLVLGIYLIAKRKSPNFFTARLIGVYTILIAILLFSHIDYLKDTDLSNMGILRSTLDNIMAATSDITDLSNTGGGMIGALFSVLFAALFDIEGTKIVVIVLILFGLIMLFDITLIDLFEFITRPVKRLIEKRREGKRIHIDDMAGDEESEDDGRIVISSMDELSIPKHEHEVVNEQLSIEEFERTYAFPPIDLLSPSNNKGKINSTEFIVSNTKILEQVFKDFAIVGKVVEVHPGPTVTQYEVELQAGTKVNKVLSIEKEISLALAAKGGGVRIQAPIPGKNTIGIEVPNPVIAEVKIRDILEKIPRKLDYSKLLVPLGKDIMGNAQYFEINKGPHMLIAGATGSGKSVCINNFITTILMRARPDEVRLVLIDPKKVELSVYEGVPHLLRPVVTDPKKASVALQKLVEEMERRYELFNETGTKSLATYNDYVKKKNSRNPESKIETLPYILIIIDEVADLMMVAAKEVEESITRIAQLARAAGIHLIVATQRPSTDVITGLIKANILTRLSFAVPSSIDSRTILDRMGAEKLLGKGDMLFFPMGDSVPTRIQGCFISDDEIKNVVDFVRRGQKPVFDDKFINLEKTEKQEESAYEYDDDPLYNEILEFAINTGKISASLIQRKYHLGYNRAARIIDLFEERGIVGAANGSKPRTVLVKLEDK